MSLVEPTSRTTPLLHPYLVRKVRAASAAEKLNGRDWYLSSLQNWQNPLGSSDHTRARPDSLQCQSGRLRESPPHLRPNEVEAVALVDKNVLRPGFDRNRPRPRPTTLRRGDPCVPLEQRAPPRPRQGEREPSSSARARAVQILVCGRS